MFLATKLLQQSLNNKKKKTYFNFIKRNRGFCAFRYLRYLGANIVHSHITIKTKNYNIGTVV